VIWIPSVLTVFSLRTFSREVKVVQSCINNVVYSSFPSLCIGDNYGTVLESFIFILSAVIDLNGRYFGGRVVKACFFNLDKFRRLDLSADVDMPT